MKRRTFGITLLALLVLFFAVAGLARFYQAVQKWALLEELLPISPAYLAVNGLVWGVVGAALFWGLWTLRPNIGRYLLAAAALYSLNYWLERAWPAIAGAGGAAGGGNWQFLALLNLVVLLWIGWEFFRPETWRRNKERYDG